MGDPYQDGRDAALALEVGDQAHAARVYATRAGYLPGSPERRAFCAGFAEYKPALSVDPSGRILAIYRDGKETG